MGEKSPENAVFGPFLAQNRDFRPQNRPISKNFSHKGTKSPRSLRLFRSVFAPWRLGVRRLPDRSPSVVVFGPFDPRFSSHKGTKSPSSVRPFKSFFAPWRLGVRWLPDRSPSPFASFACFVVEPAVPSYWATTDPTSVSIGVHPWLAPSFLPIRPDLLSVGIRS